MGKVLMGGGGGGSATSDDCTATTAQVLEGYTAITSDSDGEAELGSMTNRGAVSQSLNCGASYTVPQGYHNGSGKVTANSLSSQTSGTATASRILSGYTAWVSGSQITGNISSMSGGTYTPSTSSQTISCSSKYMTSNVVISAIPSNYLDITNGQTVFSSGVFGSIVNQGYGVDYEFSSSSGIYLVYSSEDTPNITDVDGSQRILFSFSSNRNERGLLIKGTINMTKFSSITVNWYMDSVGDTSCYNYIRIVGSDKKTSLAYGSGSRHNTSDYSFTQTLDLSSVNQHGFILVSGYYGGNGAARLCIDSIKLNV